MGVWCDFVGGEGAEDTFGVEVEVGDVCDLGEGLEEGLDDFGVPVLADEERATFQAGESGFGFTAILFERGSPRFLPSLNAVEVIVCHEG